MTATTNTFDAQFAALTGLQPFSWQARLFRRFANGDVPSAVDLPTGLGKTSVMAIWLIARAHGAALPRRLVYVVDRRVVVDQASGEAERIAESLQADDPITKDLSQRLGIGEGGLAVSTLRGGRADCHHRGHRRSYRLAALVLRVSA
jgi:CRISPR-associated endonuclease/helicase Cas3